MKNVLGYGNYYKHLKMNIKIMMKWENNRYKFDYYIGTKKQVEFEKVCDKIKDNDDLYSEI